jgi:hypothetical protein
MAPNPQVVMKIKQGNVRARLPAPVCSEHSVAPSWQQHLGIQGRSPERHIFSVRASLISCNSLLTCGVLIPKTHLGASQSTPRAYLVVQGVTEVGCGQQNLHGV